MWLFGLTPCADRPNQGEVETDKSARAGATSFEDSSNAGLVGGVGGVGDGGAVTALMKKRNVAPNPSTLSAFYKYVSY